MFCNFYPISFCEYWWLLIKTINAFKLNWTNRDIEHAFEINRTFAITVLKISRSCSLVFKMSWKHTTNKKKTARQSNFYDIKWSVVHRWNRYLSVNVTVFRLSITVIRNRFWSGGLYRRNWSTEMYDIYRWLSITILEQYLKFCCFLL